MYTPQPSGSGVKTALVAGGLVALLVSNIALWYRLETTRTEDRTTSQAMLAEIASLKEAATVTTASQRRNVESLKSELETARQQANQAAGHAKQEAQAHADELAKRLAAEQVRQQAEVQSKITDVQQQANTKIGEVSGDVSTVKTELGSTKAELDKTIANLNKVTGDLGVTSGYVATNAKELEALKQRGERNYFDFNLTKGTKQPTRVADVTLALKSVDTKHHRYTLELMADDVKIEKKDKSINEPVQFYVSKRLYELVANQVQKNQIVGYLSTPRNPAPRN